MWIPHREAKASRVMTQTLNLEDFYSTFPTDLGMITENSAIAAPSEKTKALLNRIFVMASG
jgi:hypothetical protein